MTNTCPKCGEELKQKDNGRYCRNGCEIYTAMPHGSTFSAQYKNSEVGSTQPGSWLRRTPGIREEE